VESFEVIGKKWYKFLNTYLISKFPRSKGMRAKANFPGCEKSSFPLDARDVMELEFEE